jgi:hypothetical protein
MMLNVMGLVTVRGRRKEGGIPEERGEIPEVFEAGLVGPCAHVTQALA